VIQRVLAALAVLAAGCSAGGAAPSGGVHDVVVVSGDVTSTTTWRAGHLYRVPATIAVSGRLVVAAGVTVEFGAGAGLDVQPGGAVVADGGTAETPVVFTSSSAAPAPGDWAGITVRGSGSTFNHCEVSYAGANDTPALALVDGASATVTRCAFAHHRTSSGALSAPPALDASGASSATVLRDDLFVDDVVPLAIHAGISVDDTHVFGEGGLGNVHQAVVVRGCGHVAGNTQWRARSVPFLIGDPLGACNDVLVDATGHLVLGPSVTLKLLPQGAVRVSTGGLLTVEVTDYLTSWRDDRLGDTNGDGSATVPAPGDWYGVKRSRGAGAPACDDGAYLHYQTPNDASGDCTW
jgi:hypothetical protein